MSWSRLKYLCQDTGQYGLNVSASEYVPQELGIRLLRTTDLQVGGLLPDEDGIFVPEPVDEKFRLRANDLLLSRAGTVGRSFLVPAEATGMTFAGFLVRFRPLPNIDARFVAYSMQSTPVQEQVQAEAITSTIQNFNAERYGNLRIWCPSLEEQKAISDFLDVEVPLLDRTIALRQRQIALLGMRNRTALREAAELAGATEESGVPWFPRIGSDWLVARLKHVVTCLDSRRVPLSGEQREGMKGEYPYYGASAVVDHINDYLFDDDLVLFGEDGAALENPDLDVVQRVTGKCWVNNHTHVLRTTPSLRPDYLAAYLRGADRWALISGATRPKVTQEDLLNLPIVVPPLDVQDDLLATIDRDRTDAERLTAALTRQRELLVEQKQSLITESVLGKFDLTAARSVA